VGVGSGSSLRQQVSKTRKNCFLICPPVDGLRAPSKRKRNFCGLCPPSGGEPLGGFCARQGADCRSKWVRAAFSNCDAELNEEVLTSRKFAVRNGFEDCIFFAIDRDGREVILLELEQTRDDCLPSDTPLI